MIKSGKRKRDLLEDDDGIRVLARYPKFVDTVYSLIPPQPEATPPEVYLLYGPAGCGKTRLVREEPDLWPMPVASQGWFDGYDYHDAVLFDDFAGNHLPLYFLLKAVPPSADLTTSYDFSIDTSSQSLLKDPTSGGSQNEYTFAATSTPTTGMNGSTANHCTPPSSDDSLTYDYGPPPPLSSLRCYEALSSSISSSQSMSSEDSLDPEYRNSQDSLSLTSEM